MSVKPNVLERIVDEDEIDLRDDIQNSYEDIAMSRGLTLEYVRAVAVQMFSEQELGYAMGKVS